VKITAISVHAVELPLKEGSYSWNVQSFPSFDSTVVVIDTDEGVQGYGEICPLGPAYNPAYPDGARAGIKALAPALIGLDPTNVGVVATRMRSALKGHPYVKSGIDIACWDLAGKVMGVPVVTLLGGAYRDRVELFKVISRDEPATMVDRLQEYRAQGFTKYQMKVGEVVDTDIARMHAIAEHLLSTERVSADANTGWLQHEAQRVIAATNDLPLYLEQPCLTYEECLALRPQVKGPYILDECMDSLAAIRRGAADRAMDLINLKISRFAGLSGARQARDLCVDLGVAMTIEDSWGGEIATAAIAHLAASTPDGFHFMSSAFHGYHTVAIADGGPEVADGHMSVSDRPGLGVTPDFTVLGDPLFTIR